MFVEDARIVGWAKEQSDVPTIHQPPSCEMVGTLRFAHPTDRTLTKQVRFAMFDT